MDTKKMDGGTTYVVEDESPVVFWQYASAGLDKDGSITRLVCVDCVEHVRGRLSHSLFPLWGCLASDFPYDYVEAEVEFHPELEHYSMADGCKWLYYSELEREYLVCSNCDEVFLTYWPETRMVASTKH